LTTQKYEVPGVPRYGGCFPRDPIDGSRAV
jgi:hypothetical protein